MFKTKGTFFPIETSSSWLAKNKLAFSYCFSKQGEGKEEMEGRERINQDNIC